jgi:hypothetical protein
MTTSSSIHPASEISCFSLISIKSDFIRPKSKIKHWLDSIEIKNARVANLICRLIPASCPFERDIKFFGRILFHIPPLCHLNPFYDEFIALRFRALVFLSEY